MNSHSGGFIGKYVSNGSVSINNCYINNGITYNKQGPGGFIASYCSFYNMTINYTTTESSLIEK